MNKMNKEIILKSSEIMMAATVGVMRQVTAINDGLADRFGATAEGGWQRDVEGALSECALAKYLNLYWKGKGDFTADIGERHEVRVTWRSDGRLILHNDSNDTNVFWLLVGLNGTYEVKGWLLGADGKADEFWSDPVGGRPAFFVPQHRLMPPEDLPEEWRQ